MSCDASDREFAAQWLCGQADEPCVTFEVAAECDTFSRKTFDQPKFRGKLDSEA